MEAIVIGNKIFRKRNIKGKECWEEMTIKEQSESRSEILKMFTNEDLIQEVIERTEKKEAIAISDYFK